MRKHVSLGLAALLAAAARTACGGSGGTATTSETTAAQTEAAETETAEAASSEESTEAAETPAELEKIVVGASPAPHAEILEAAKPILEEKGYELDIREYTDYVQPNNALEAGDLDANYFQHLPYLESFNEQFGTHLVSAAQIHYEPFAVYPGKTASLEELPDGATVAVPNDVTNEARALQLLAAQGLITLKDGVGLSATVADIVDNPKNLKIEEVVAAQIPNLLADVDLGVANGNYALGAGIADTAIAKEDATSEAAQTYPNVLAIREGDDRPEIQALIKAMTSPEVKSYIENTYKGTVIAVF